MFSSPIRVVITPPITPNNFWGFSKRNSPGKITPCCLLSLLGKITYVITPRIVRELIGAIVGELIL